MIQINIGDHTSPIPRFTPVSADVLWQFRWARQHAFWIAANKPDADLFFRSMPNHRSLTNLLEDGSIWINFYPATKKGDFGLTFTPQKEIGISSASTAVGQWTVLGTLIHELGHINGAGDPPDTTAEDALVPCGLGYIKELISGKDDPFTPYNPNVRG